MAGGMECYPYIAQGIAWRLLEVEAQGEGNGLYAIFAKMWIIWICMLVVTYIMPLVSMFHEVLQKNGIKHDFQQNVPF